jgi:ribosomal protein S18 acetylase RimI-like enzyme
LNITQYYSGQNGRFWVAINHENKIIGHIALDATCSSSKFKTVELRRLAVATEYRRFGVGTRLVEHLTEKALQDFKADHIFLTTSCLQIPAIKMYQKFGFVITNPMLYRWMINAPEIKMEKYF